MYMSQYMRMPARRPYRTAQRNANQQATPAVQQNSFSTIITDPIELIMRQKQIAAGCITLTSRKEALDQASLPPGKPFSTFTRFPNLPLELRLMIWELSCTTARRIVALDIRNARYPCRNSKAPGTTAANHESREVTLKHYVDITAQYNHWYEKRKLAPRYSQYINFERDIATLDITSMDPEFWKAEQPFKAWIGESQDIVGKIQRLEIEGFGTYWWKAFQNSSFEVERSMKIYLTMFKEVEKVSFYVDCSGLWKTSTMDEKLKNMKDWKGKIERRWGPFFASMPKKPKLTILAGTWNVDDRTWDLN